MAALKATPLSERVVADPEVRFREPAESGPAVDTAPPAALRRFRLHVADLVKYGRTDSCQQCQHVMRYGKAKPGIQRTEHCRKRIIEAMSQDEHGKRRLGEYEDRTNRTMAEQIERTHGDADQAARDDRAAAPEVSDAHAHRLRFFCR